MATEFCQRCKQSHPGRVCDYDDEGECAETTDTQDGTESKVSDDTPRTPRRSSPEAKEGTAALPSALALLLTCQRLQRRTAPL
jgi:hypothetical protein